MDKEMSKKITEYFRSKALCILDFGCGTGFEAQQLLQNIPVSSIDALTCNVPLTIRNQFPLLDSIAVGTYLIGV